MGMFDYVRVEYPLSVAGANDIVYQTKNLINELDWYKIDKDGQLWHEVYDYDLETDEKVNKSWLTVSDFSGFMYLQGPFVINGGVGKSFNLRFEFVGGLVRDCMILY